MAGKLMIEAKDIAKSYGGRAVVRPFSIRIARGERIGVIGANGAGKTTSSPSDRNAEPRWRRRDAVARHRARDAGPAPRQLRTNWTLREAITDGRGDIIEVAGERKHVMGYLKDFLFTPEQARTPIGVLSGGERARLMLARALAKPSNLLVLDEPTNDLDLGDARPAAGDVRRLSRHGNPGQP